MGALVVFRTHQVESYNALSLAERKPSGIIVARWYLFPATFVCPEAGKLRHKTQQSKKGEGVHPLSPGENNP